MHRLNDSIRIKDRQAENCWHTDCTQTNTDEESSEEIKGYLGRVGRVGSRACLKVSWCVSSISSGSTGKGYALE